MRAKAQQISSVSALHDMKREQPDADCSFYVCSLFFLPAELMAAALHLHGLCLIRQIHRTSAACRDRHLPGNRAVLPCPETGHLAADGLDLRTGIRRFMREIRPEDDVLPARMGRNVLLYPSTADVLGKVRLLGTYLNLPSRMPYREQVG